MASHYYNNNLETKSNEKIIECQILGNLLKFITDHGVFSKGGIDYGSKLLVENCQFKPEDNRVLDIGCGYGAIGISLAKKYPHIHFDLVDVNLRALDLAKRNYLLNNIHNITVFESNIYEKINNKYDCIVSNPPIRAGKKIVYQIFEKAIDYLNDNGSIYIVMKKNHGAKSAIKKLTEVFHNCEIVYRDKGYYVFKSTKSM